MRDAGNERKTQVTEKGKRRKKKKKERK